MASVGEAVKPVWNFRQQFPNLFMRSFMYGVVGSLAMFISSWDTTDKMRDQFLQKNRDYGDTFDFIVVGGGTAGSIVAKRLSKEYKVLLLEAGGEPHPFHIIPFMANFMSSYKEVDWMFDTTQQKDALFGSTENKARISAGKGLGGTSNLDYMMYLRGHPRDYDNWAKVTNDSSWSYENVLKYFKRHEKYDGPWKDKGEKGMHGDEGEMRLSMPPYSSLANRFVVAGNEMGVPHVDLNAHYGEGVDMLVYPMKAGQRQTAFKSFLKGHKETWDLVVHKYSQVTKILTHGENNEAYAVEYIRHGQTKHAYAKKEIILSAGAINSPKILMLSGIGDSSQLQGLGIPAKVHLPGVGQNLQDHMAVHLGPFFTAPLHTLLIDRDLSPLSFLSYTMGQGPLTTTGYEAVAMMTSDQVKTSPHTNPHWPDVQLTINSVALHSTADDDMAHATRLKRSLLQQYYEGGKNRDSFSILVSAARPKSLGEVRLADNNPLSPPLVDPRYLEKVEDVGVFVDGIKKTMRMMENTFKFREINATFTDKSVEGCGSYKFKSDEYWSCYVRVMGVSMGDVVGTLGMGRVVNNQLQVMGTQRLRVMDASVMPSIVSGGTTAATLMIGEKGADMILNYWGTPESKSSRLKQEVTQVRNTLSASASQLREVNGSSLFFNYMKDTPTFKENSKPNYSLLSPAGWANLFRPLHDFGSVWGQFNNIRLTDPNAPSNQIQVKRPTLPPLTTTTTTAPLSFTYQHTPPSFRYQPSPSSFQPTPQKQHVPIVEISLTSLKPPDPTTEAVAALFETSYEKYPTHEINAGQQESSYVLTPKSTPTPFDHVPTEKTFSSSVNSFLEQYHPHMVPNGGPKFSKALPILGFASVGVNNNGNGDSYSSHSVSSLSIHDAPLGLDTHITKFIGPTTTKSPEIAMPEKISTSTPSPLKTLLGAPFKIATAPFKLVTKAFEPLQKINFQFKPLSQIISGVGSNGKTAVTKITPTTTTTTPAPYKSAGEDYAFMDENGEETPQAGATLPPPLPLGEQYKLIYKAFTPPHVKKAYSNLAENVQEILEWGGKGVVQPSRKPIYMPVEMKVKPPIWIENDPKSLDEEVEKLLVTRPCYFVPVVAQTPEARKEIPFTHVIHKILERHEKYKAINGNSDDSESEENQGQIKSNSVTGAINEVVSKPAEDYPALWPTPAAAPSQENNMSFRIKILKHK